MSEYTGLSLADCSHSTLVVHPCSLSFLGGFRDSLKGENTDIIHDSSEVHTTGLYCHIDEFQPLAAPNGKGEPDAEEAWQMRLQPLSRITINSVKVEENPVGVTEKEVLATEIVEEEVVKADANEGPESEVTSFEKADEPMEDKAKKGKGMLGLVFSKYLDGSLTFV